MPRKYEMRFRSQAVEGSRVTIIAAAKTLLETQPLGSFSLDSVAKAASVSRVTIYNLFHSRSELIHAVFDSVAGDGGLMDVGYLVNDPNPWIALNRYVAAFVDFYAANRNLFRRFRAIAATDSDFSAAFGTREDRKRVDGLTKILIRLYKSNQKRIPGAKRIDSEALMLKALLSFEVFDALLEDGRQLVKVRHEIQGMVTSIVQSLHRHSGDVRAIAFGHDLTK